MTAGRRQLPALAIVQCGGPTAVLNASLAGCLRATTGRFTAHGVVGGPVGLVRGDRQPLAAGDVPADLATRPGAFLGAGRHPLTADDLDTVAGRFAADDLRHLVLMGGNGTMALAAALSQAARFGGHELAVVGVPKTVDNDLAGIDHAPGFPSAAGFLRSVIGALAADHQAMAGMEPVRIVETLGRDSGWLAAAAATALGPAGAPDLVFTPEQDLSAERIVETIATAYQRAGRVFAVVAEGVAPELTAGRFAGTNHSTPILGGVSRGIAELVSARCRVAARGEVIGLAQRAMTSAATARDRAEADRLGVEAVNALVDGAHDVLVGPDGPAADANIVAVSLSAVAGRARRLPPAWVPAVTGPTAEFRDWLATVLEPDPRDRPPSSQQLSSQQPSSCTSMPLGAAVRRRGNPGEDD